MTSAKGADKARAEESPIHAVLAGLEEGAKYEDPDFPASAASLGAWTEGAGSTEVVWLRPEELKRTDYAPGRLFGDGVEPDDVEQGALGDDGLCAALVALAECSTRVRALYQFIGEDSDELDFEAGDEFLLLSATHEYNGWWIGQVRKRIGWFPSTFVRIVQRAGRSNSIVSRL